MFKNKKKKLGTHNICVPGIMGTHNIFQLFLWQALECSEISSPIIEPIKNQAHLQARQRGLQVRGADVPEGGPAFKPPNRGTLSYPPTSNFPSTQACLVE
jgi:hypothetical protein